MIGLLRFRDIPQFLVGGAISICFLLILVPVWIANPGLVNSPFAALAQLGFVVIISMVAAGRLCSWMKHDARLARAAPATAGTMPKAENLPSQGPTTNDSGGLPSPGAPSFASSAKGGIDNSSHHRLFRQPVSS